MGIELKEWAPARPPSQLDDAPAWMDVLRGREVHCILYDGDGQPKLALSAPLSFEVTGEAWIGAPERIRATFRLPDGGAPTIAKGDLATLGASDRMPRGYVVGYVEVTHGHGRSEVTLELIETAPFNPAYDAIV